MIFERLVADPRQTRSIVDQIVLKLPQVVQRDVLAMEKRLKDKIQTELSVPKSRIDGLEVHVTNHIHAIGSVNTEELKGQLAEMRDDIAKVSRKPVTMPPSCSRFFDKPIQ
ncbi:hypothetical protein KY285_015052 [Solanum tuberosum]|nr:hypothetical protein KY285_015052 [Solanum tuberosum]